jgi:hypothetical protein
MECEKWHVTICPKIKKKLDKLTDISGNYTIGLMEFSKLLLENMREVTLWI